ncbi:MAG: hypothetical protein ACK53Y_01275, partial [bacterium]
ENTGVIPHSYHNLQKRRGIDIDNVFVDHYSSVRVAMNVANAMIDGLAEYERRKRDGKEATPTRRRDRARSRKLSKRTTWDGDQTQTGAGEGFGGRYKRLSLPHRGEAKKETGGD